MLANNVKKGEWTKQKRTKIGYHKRNILIGGLHAHFTRTSQFHNQSKIICGTHNVLMIMLVGLATESHAADT